MVAHSLQLATKEFQKIRELKISNLKGGYLANAMMVLNPGLKLLICMYRTATVQFGSSTTYKELHQ